MSRNPGLILHYERDIEEQLVKHVTRYLLEMGNGFAFVARQKHFQVGNSDFFADLILYSIPLHAYIVVELKATPFKPEYAGQLNFYRTQRPEWGR